MQQPSGILLDSRVQIAVITVGLLTFVCVGVLACLALVMAAFWLVVQFILIVLQSVVAMAAAMALIWVSADPFLKVLILASLAYGVYRFYRWWHIKKGVK